MCWACTITINSTNLLYYLLYCKITRLAGHLQPRRNWPTWGSQCLDNLPHSLDLAPSDYQLFHGLKKQLKSRHFSPEAEVIAVPETWLDLQLS